MQDRNIGRYLHNMDIAEDRIRSAATGIFGPNGDILSGEHLLAEIDAALARLHSARALLAELHGHQRGERGGEA